MKDAPNGVCVGTLIARGCLRFHKELDGKPIVEIMDARAHFAHFGLGEICFGGSSIFNITKCFQSFFIFIRTWGDDPI